MKAVRQTKVAGKTKESVCIPDAQGLWDYIVREGQKVESQRVANCFDKSDVTTVLATMEFFGATPQWIRQTLYDLRGAPRYRLFDWLAMCVMGRNDDNRKQNADALKVLVYSWLKVKGEPRAFIQDLRETDYDIDRSWEGVRLPPDVEPCGLVPCGLKAGEVIDDAS